jgi:hypothetical protein
MKTILLLFLVGSVFGGTPCESRCYLSQMIRCEESDERYVDDAYNVVIQLISREIVGKGSFEYPVHLTRESGDVVFISRAFYLTPNVCRGFELGIPRDCLLVNGRLFSLREDLVLKHQEGKQGAIIVTAKKVTKVP